MSNFRGEVTINGVLTSSRGTKVSNGVEVAFLDFLENGELANGLYRTEKLKSDSSSIVSVVYTPSDIVPNQFVSIRGIVLDSLEQHPDIESSTNIYILENE